MALEQRYPREEEVAVPFYAIGTGIYLSLKLCKDRGSRKEDVEVLKGMYDEQQKRNVGWKIWKKAFGGEETNGGDDTPPQQ